MASKLSANLKRLRKAKGLTQQQVAEAIGLSQPAQVSQWEGGKRAPNHSNLKRLAAFFAVSISGLDPEQEAWDAEKPRAGRHLEQQSHIPPQLHVAAPPPQPTGADMGPGDQELAFVQSVWGILTPELRKNLAEHARELAHRATAPSESPRKKASR